MAARFFRPLGEQERFHGRHRDSNGGGDLFVGTVFEARQGQGHSLPRRQGRQCAPQPGFTVGGDQFIPGRRAPGSEVPLQRQGSRARSLALLEIQAGVDRQAIEPGAEQGFAAEGTRMAPDLE